MSTLHELLAQTSYPLLCVIGRQRGLRVPHNIAKADLVAYLALALADPDALQAACAALPSAAKAVLEELILADGRLPRYHIARRHGDLRPYRPWQPDAPARPWEHPQTPTERLYFLGLLFWEQATRDLVIPEDLLIHYPTPPSPGVLRVTPSAITVETLSAVLAARHDVAQLLALLAEQDLRLLHDRWLSPVPLRIWGSRCVISPQHPEARSELQTKRRCFLHYVAESAGIVALSGPYLKPTPAAWQWLDAAPVEQLRTLWMTIAAPPRAIWRRYRLPGYEGLRPQTMIDALLGYLRRYAPEPPDSTTLGTPAALSTRLQAVDPKPRDCLRQTFFEPETWLTETYSALLTGPLAWLSAIAVASDDQLQLTTWGAHWLGLAAPPKVASHAPFTPTPPLVFRSPGPTLDPVALVTLAACAEWKADAYRITQASWVRALHQGHRFPALLARLNRVAQRPLTGEEINQLTTWAEAANRMTLHRLTVLEATDPAILARLSGSRRGRKHIVRTLSRRAVVVDEARLELLIRRLTLQEDMPPRVEIAPREKARASTLGAGGAAYLWLTAKVYQALGDVIDLPATVPFGLLAHLARVAEPQALAAAEVAIQRTLDVLYEVLAGRSPFPVWTAITLPVEESMAQIKEALTTGQALEIEYYTAGRNVVTQRVVEPHRLEYRGQIAYLVGFCQWAQAERTFRVDRIRAIRLVPPTPDPGLDWNY